MDPNNSCTLATSEEPVGWPEDAGRDRLIGDWHIYQRSSGHRTSTDDLICAWYAVHRSSATGRKRIERYLDLGCGVGSVLFMVCHKMHPVEAIGIEAQVQSVLMAERAQRELPAHNTKIGIVKADIRELSADLVGDGFKLVTGSPPYFPLDAGVLPKDPQRRACRFEARGGVEVYMSAAAQALHEDGRFYLVHQTRWTQRVLGAASNSKLQLTGQADFLMRSDRPQPFLSVFEFAKHSVPELHRFSCAVRNENGEITSDYQALRRELGVQEH